jgi:hypothetical protein
VFSSYRSPISTTIILFLGASEPVSGFIGAKGVLCSGSFIVIITSSLVLLILGAFIGLNIITTSPRSSFF